MAFDLNSSLSALQLISGWLDQQDASNAANDALGMNKDALKAQLKMAMQQLATDNELRSRVVDQVNNYQTTLANGLNSLGPYGKNLWDDSELNGQINLNRGIYRRNAEDAANLAFSTEQATQMRNGVDDSTLNIDMRAGMAKKVAELYDEADKSAREDALSFITNLNQGRWAGLDQNVKLRAGLVDETSAVYDPAMKYLASMIGDGNKALAYASGSAGSLFDSLNTGAINSSKGFGYALDNFLKEYGPSINDWINSNSTRSDDWKYN